MKKFWAYTGRYNIGFRVNRAKVPNNGLTLKTAQNGYYSTYFWGSGRVESVGLHPPHLEPKPPSPPPAQGNLE